MRQMMIDAFCLVMSWYFGIFGEMFGDMIHFSSSQRAFERFCRLLPGASDVPSSLGLTQQDEKVLRKVVGE